MLKWLVECPTITLKLNDRENAETVFDLYEKTIEESKSPNKVNIQKGIPGGREGWAKSLSFPVELFFIFPDKRSAGKCLRKITRDPFIKVDILFHF